MRRASVDFPLPFSPVNSVTPRSDRTPDAWRKNRFFSRIRSRAKSAVDCITAKRALRSSAVAGTRQTPHPVSGLYHRKSSQVSPRRSLCHLSVPGRAASTAVNRCGPVAPLSVTRSCGRRLPHKCAYSAIVSGWSVTTSTSVPYVRKFTLSNCFEERDFRRGVMRLDSGFFVTVPNDRTPWNSWPPRPLH